ncbi:hypothetical protein TWF481_011018 [Arthrobotrys musiformis]|uniref:F-box domain-containing protein n=1 Tax=Arthrobotrys musiformis TaxID=47236 RepID=A0AAV9W012_9PEZI
MPPLGKEFGIPMKADGQCLLQEIPPELCFLIAGFLDSDGLAGLSKTSRFWYHFLFLRRIRGLRLGRRSRRQLSHLERFSDGKSFAPLRQHIRSLTLGIGGILNLHRTAGLLSTFTDITSVLVFVRWNGYIERNLYVAIISRLSTLLFYEDIESIKIAFRWSSNGMGGLSDSEGYFSSSQNSSYLGSPTRSSVRRPASELGSGTGDTASSESDISDIEYPYRNLEEEERSHRVQFLWQAKQRPWARSNDFLGRYLSKNALGKLSRTKRLSLPRNLKYFNITMEDEDPLLCLPLINCRNLTALHIASRFCGPIKDPRQPNELVKFVTIKALELSYRSWARNEDFPKIPMQFPSLRLLMISSNMPPPSWPEIIPNFPKLVYLHISSSEPDGLGLGGYNVSEGQLMKRLESGDFPALRTFKVSSDAHMGFEFDFSTATISRVRDEYDQSVSFKFDWVRGSPGEGCAEGTWLDAMWNSGTLYSNMQPLDGEVEETEEIKSEVEELASDESIYDSEDDRIAMDRRLRIRDMKREKAKERRRRVKKEEKKWERLDAIARGESVSSRDSDGYRYSDIDFSDFEAKREARRKEREGEGEREEQGLEEEEGKEIPRHEYGYMHFGEDTDVIDARSEASSIAEVEGEEADDEIGHTASQYLSLSADNDDEILPEDPDEYEGDIEMDENDTQEPLDSLDDPHFNVSYHNCRSDEEDNTQYGSQYSQFDTQEYLANAANMAQEPLPKPERSINLTMDPREVEKIRNKNLYRR